MSSIKKKNCPENAGWANIDINPLYCQHMGKDFKSMSTVFAPGSGDLTFASLVDVFSQRNRSGTF